MTTESENFAVDLAANTKTHEEWLSVVRFGLGTLLNNQALLAEILVAEAMREASKIPNHKSSDEIAPILNELGLRLCTGVITAPNGSMKHAKEIEEAVEKLIKLNPQLPVSFRIEARHIVKAAIDKAIIHRCPDCGSWITRPRIRQTSQEGPMTPLVPESKREQIAREAMIKLQDRYIQIDPRIGLPIIQAAIDKAHTEWLRENTGRVLHIGTTGLNL